MKGTSPHTAGVKSPPRERLRRIFTPVELREFLIRQGPTFIKIGQFLSLRPDILPQDYCDELLKLVDQVPPFPLDDVRAIIIADLGRPPEELFDWFNPQPVAAGSLAQVHEALLSDGRRVAVKVQRPLVRERVERDLRRVSRVVRLLDLMGVIAVVRPADLLDELRRWMSDELDMRRELANVERLHRLNEGNPRMYVPGAFRSLSGERVVTTDFVAGVSFSDLLRAAADGGDEAVRALGVEPERLAENLLWGVLEQIFRYEFFHADTHPGNLIALPGNVVGFVDFGFVETLDETDRTKHIAYLSALYFGETDAAYRALLDILDTTPESDLEGFRSDFLALTRAWNRDKNLPTEASADQWPLSSYMAGQMRSARHRRMVVPAEVLSMYRCLLTAETVAHRLGGQVDLRSVGTQFFGTLQYDQMFRLLQPAATQGLFLDVLTLLRNGPGDVQRILSDLAGERLTLHVRTEQERDDRLQENTRSHLTAAAVIFLGLAVLIAGAHDAALAGPLRLMHVLWAAMIALTLFLIVLWRRLS